MERPGREHLIEELRKNILLLQGSQKSGEGSSVAGLGPIEEAFPNKAFPDGTLHEFISTDHEAAAATSGFMAALLKNLSDSSSFCVWISSRRRIFPPALKLMGIDPGSIVFIDLQRDKDVLWAVEEALKCDVLAAIVGETQELSFAHSRRLQLAIEKSGVTTFIHRVAPKAENPTACAARWKISPLPGIIRDEMPGIGFPKWNVGLLKVRNGNPGSWETGWTPNGFVHFPKKASGTASEPNTARYA